MLKQWDAQGNAALKYLGLPANQFQVLSTHWGSSALEKCVWGYLLLGLAPAVQRSNAADLHDMTSGSPAHSYFCWKMLAHATQLTRGPVGTECTVLAPGFTKPAAALSVRGLLAMQQVLADVVGNGLPADVQVDFIFLQGICE